ncbi:hypothetical protein D3C87_650880 [compost metagenome]
MYQELNRYFVPSEYFPATWHVRVDIPEANNITPVIHSEFYDEIRNFCTHYWPDGEGWDWTLDTNHGTITIHDKDKFMLLKLALST